MPTESMAGHRCEKTVKCWAFELEPPIGIEPMTYALREAREYAAQPLPAQTARRIALHALVPLEFRGPSFHGPFHAACTRSASRPVNLASEVGSRPVASRSVGRVLCRGISGLRRCDARVR
jgi:hypothetical protein